MKIFKKIDRIHVLDERFYTRDNETFYPSITTVLSAYPKDPIFLEWLKNNGRNADDIRDEAAFQGTVVHDAIEQFLKGKKLVWIDEKGNENYNLIQWRMICRFMDFYNRYKPEVLGIESMLFSDSLEAGGTADLICKIMGEVWLIDFKTSNYMHKTYQLQLAAYKEMIEETLNIKVDRYGVLWLKASTRTEKDLQGVGWQIKEFTKDHDHNLNLYLHTRALWDEENPNYKPKNLEFPNSFEI